MSLVGAARVDKKLIAHLSHGGEIEDSISAMLVAQLIRESLENEAIGRAVRHHGLPNELLAEIYTTSFDALLPDPLIRHGIAPILVPSLIFIDQNFLPKLLDHWVSSAYGIHDAGIKNSIIVDAAVEFIVGLRDAAETQCKVLPWPKLDSPTFEQLERKNGAGCLGMLCILGSLGIGALAAFNYA
jgi:hypothetical protein